MRAMVSEQVHVDKIDLGCLDHLHKSDVIMAPCSTSTGNFMQLSFDPSNPDECATVAVILDALHSGEDAPRIDTSAPHLTLAAVAPDTRDPAAAFGTAGAAPLPPLPGAQSLAAAMQPFSAPGAPLGGAPTLPTGGLPLAATGPVPGAAPLVPATPGNPAGGVDVDSTGLPWDGRIHASTKSRTKDGKWTKLRGFNDEAKYKAIEAEIRATMALPSPGALPLAPAAGAALPMQAAPNTALTPGAGGLPGLPASTAAPLLPPAAASPSSVPQNFDELMPRVTAALGKTLPDGALEWAIAQQGLQGTVALIQRPDYVPAVWTILKTHYPALQ